MRLLIAEDELDLAEALTVFFEKNQFSVDTVHDGFAAYDYASTGEYDAIVLDVMMPKMDGVQVLQRLREEGVRTPVMMLTARTTASPASTPGRTIICPSPLNRMSSSAGYGPCSGGAGRTSPQCWPSGM